MGYTYSNSYHYHYSLTFIVVVALLSWVLGSIPVYEIGRRLGVRSPGVAFIPLVGTTIVLLRSIKRSGWLCLVGLIPLVNLVFFLWLIFVIPAEHGRTRWWGLAFLTPVVSLFAIYAYAFTLDPYARSRSAAAAGAIGSTYHVPPGGDWRDGDWRP